MSFPNYGSYISGRRAYRSGESCLAAGPKGNKGEPNGQKGEPGATGATGSTGSTGITGAGYTAMGTYTFAMRLQGESTWEDWLHNTSTGNYGRPPTTGVDFSGFVGSFKDLEFITPGAFCTFDTTALNNQLLSFPIVDATTSLTLDISDRAANNCLFAYVLPASGQLLGFTIDLVQTPSAKNEFYCFIWDPNGSGGGSARFVGPITSPAAPEKFSSAYNFNEESKIKCKAGNYLFAVQKVTGVNAAKDLAHITAYIRYDN